MAEETAEEPSIEEILDSIRQIISDDDEEGGDDSASEEVVETAPAEPEPAVVPEPEPAAVEPDIEPEPPAEDIVELTDKIADEPEPEPAPDIEVDLQDIDVPPEPEPPPQPRPAASTDKIVQGQAEAATMEAFEELARTANVERQGQVTIEDVVREEIRPLLRDWLDNHLPGIVERLLEQEMHRISARYLDD